jgi:hypothetical protein
MEAMRAPYVDPESVPDRGFDPEFLDRADPLLDFLFSKYFRVRLTGMENVPLEGPPWLWPTTRAACPTTGPC